MILKPIFTLLLISVFTVVGFSQEKYFTKEAEITFVSKSEVIVIDGTNKKSGSIFNINTGELVFIVIVDDFDFHIPLAEEHFNENYLESEVYPKAKFKGKIKDYQKLDLKKDGTYPVIVEGEMKIHGVTKDVTEKGILSIENGEIKAESHFFILLKDYNIKIPSLVSDKVNEKIAISVSAKYKPFNP
ncbi:MAG: YceI family protein [Marinilabiliales bacterium]|nr:MAG: YceI family protein [Marinilabiliales bacterium]